MNVRQVRKKIKSITNVKKITKAMELVSGIKMRKAQTLEIEGRPYRTNLEQIMYQLVGGIDATISPLIENKKAAKSKKKLLILVTSNKGLCGAFNVNMFRFLIKTIDFAEFEFITVGKKGAYMVSRMGGSIIADFSEGQPLDQVSAIFNLCLTKFLSGNYQRVGLAYTKFISTLRSEPLRKPILPLTLAALNQEGKPAKKQNDAYVVEPSADKIIDSLLKDYLETEIRGAIISSEAVEHSSRMIAMKNATDNANDVIYNFTLLGNKLRQEKITNELLDMVTAKISVEGG